MRKRLLKLIGSTVIVLMMFVSSAVTSLAASANYPLVDGYANITSLKGRQNWQEAEAKGERFVFRNLDITEYYLPDDYIDVGIPYYEFEGKQYRFANPDDIFNWIKARNKMGETVNVQFMVSWESRNSDGYGTLSQRRLLIDEAARTPGHPYYAPATSGEGRQIMRAFWSWFMDSLAAKGAHIDNMILGNEVTAPNSWHYSGNIGTQATVEKYASAFYDMRQIVRKYSDKTRVSVCFDHTWNYYDGVIGGKEFLRIFNDKLTNLNGGTVVDDWCVALHLYPSVLYEPAIWQNHPPYPSNMNELSENTRWVDGKNLSYVTNYIKNTYGENHRIMLTEQGFTSYRGDAIQAASLAYSYYAAKYDPMVDCFILFTEQTGDSKLDFRINGRTAQYVYENIDDPAHQANIASMVLPTIGVSSWNQIIPNFGQNIQRKQYQGSGFTGKINPTGITLNTTSMTLTTGKSQTLTATIVPSNATDKTVTWTSSNPSVASVDNGVVTAWTAGTTIITAQTANGLQAQCTVNVIVEPYGIGLYTSMLNIPLGQSDTLIAVVVPENATDKTVTWTSSNPAVATVNNGVITAKAVGTTTITAQTVNGLQTQCTVNVIIEPYGIGLYTSTLNIPLGQSDTLTAVVVPENATDKTVTWTSSNPAVATVNNGVITAKAVGTTTITAQTVNGLQTQCTVHVIINPTGITLDTSEANMIKDDVRTLNAIITPSDAAETTITWTSSDTNVAIVNSKGEVTATGVGIAVITAETINGFKAECTIYVTVDNDPDNPFADVSPSGGWEYQFVKYVYDNQYMSGKEEIIPGKVKFDPNAELTRAEFVRILYNMEGKPEVDYTNRFEDVPNGEWFTNAVLWAAEQEIVVGTGENGEKFDVYGIATREQMAVMFCKYAKYKKCELSIPEGSKNVDDFEDADLIASWAHDAMQWAVSYGIMVGKDANMEPLESALRSECAAMLKHFKEAFPED